MVIALSIITGLLFLMIVGTIVRIKKLQEVVISHDKEQHDQNKLIFDLIKDNQQMKEMLLQHIEILQYLCDQDPLLKKSRIPYTGPIGEA